ncbi:MAG: UDP-N-acetylmuramate--L-alanine ligase [Lachnospiraceae bacterium]
MYQIHFDTPIHIFFCGIGGISMSGLAEVLLDKRFQVSGSDMKGSSLTDSLTQKGATVYIGQKAENISTAIDCIVFTSAIHPDNPEYIQAKAFGIPMLTRAELLGQMMKNYACPIAISGTHGKTTTTSMLSEILLSADLDPTLSIGGILTKIGGNIRVGNSEYFVTEACEYTNSFLSFYPKISVILNIEEDHMDFFKDIHDIRASFHTFAKLLPSDGLLVINSDIESYEEITQDLECRVVTVGSTFDADYHPICLSANEKACMAGTIQTPQNGIYDLTLAAPGMHNLYNALAAIAVADYLHISPSIITKALSEFTGSKRRFELKGTLAGITIIDDYAHHPTEITATLMATRNYPHREVWCVFQPHTYTRTKAFLDDFAKALSLADHIILSDIYPARETDTLGISSKDLQLKIEALGKTCYHFGSFGEIETFILENCIHGDMLITMGAGDVVTIGDKLLGL